MKKIGVVLILLTLMLVGCGQEELIFKSDAYGEESQITVYLKDGKALKAKSMTVYDTEEEALEEFEYLKESDVYLNPKLEDKTITYEQTAYIKGMSKEEVKALFEEAEE